MAAYTASVSDPMSAPATLDGASKNHRFSFVYVVVKCKVTLLKISLYSREGHRCDRCVALPGCEHGSCVDDNGEGHAFDCHCKKGDVEEGGETVMKPLWEGAFCDKRELHIPQSLYIHVYSLGGMTLMPAAK